MHLVPAYGRDYKSLAELKAGLRKGHDFLIQDISSKWNGKYVNLKQLIESGSDATIRYLKLTRVGVFSLNTLKKLGESNA